MLHRRVALTVLVACLVWIAWPSSGTIYVTHSGNQYRVTVHPNGANGDVAPLRNLEGDATGLELPIQVFTDVLHDELYVANHFGPSVTVHPLGANGDQAPLRTLVGPATLIDEPNGVAVDLVHDELIVGNAAEIDDSSITVYPRTANGDLAPLRRIAGAATGLRGVAHVAVDPLAGEIFVVCGGSDGTPSGIRVFSRTANGNTAPVRTIAGPKTLISSPYGIFLDRARNEIYVTDREGSLSVFARGANGNVAPLRRIAGPNSTLLETFAVSLLGASEVVVANHGLTGNDYSDDAVLVFPRGANGDVAPLRRIRGPATGINAPTGLTVVSPRLALAGGRFGVQAVFRTPGGAVGDGQPVPLTSDTGYLWFFQAPNVEIVVKVIDGCGFNQRWWVFAGGLTDVNVDLVVTDYATGAVRVYVNPQKTPFQPIQDTSAFEGCALPGGGAVLDGGDDLPLADRGVSGDALLLNGDRFEVRAEWRKSNGATGVGHPVAITGDTGYFWFFQSANVEVVVKVLNGCGGTQRYWVFAGGLTDVEVELTVTDTQAPGLPTKTYVNPLKTPFQPIQDTSAFATCS